MGFESRAPYTNDAALAANITNEGGAEGRYRVLKNIMGLWLLQRVLKERQISDLPTLISQTQALPACQFLINPNDDRFINPDDMSAEIQAACRESGQPVPCKTPNWRAVSSTARRCCTPTSCKSWHNCVVQHLANCTLSVAAARTPY